MAKKTLSRQGFQPMDPQIPQRIIKSAEISRFKEAEKGAISNNIERTIRINLIGVILLFGVFLVPFFPGLLLIPVLGLVLIILAHTALRVKMEYSETYKTDAEYVRKINAWLLLVKGKKEWQVLAEQANNSIKFNAGAEKSIRRVECRIKKGHPYYIKTNIDTVQIKLYNNESLIILPDKVLFVRKCKVGLIDNADFIINVSPVNFVENGPIPKDSRIIGFTWRYVNKDGTPDQRFKINTQIPICQYGQVLLMSSSGLNVELQISNIKNAMAFAEMIE